MNARGRSYPGSGQNARGAGRRFREEQVALTRPFWAAWLAAIQAGHPEVTDAVLVRELAERPDDRDSHPRALLRRWQQQNGTISASNAARVGEALRTLGVSWSCAALGLYAARHYAEFLIEVHRLASTVDVEYACGVFVYSQVLADFDIYGGLPFAVKTAARAKPLNEKARREWESLAHLPQIIDRIRLQLSRAHLAVRDEGLSDHLHHAGDVADAKYALSRYLDPSIQLLQSTAPPGIAWHAVTSLLEFWLHKSMPPASENATATELLWGVSRPVASFSDGTPIIGTVVFDDRDLLKVMPTAISTERYRDVLSTPRRSRKSE